MVMWWISIALAGPGAPSVDQPASGGETLTSSSRPAMTPFVPPPVPPPPQQAVIRRVDASAARPADLVTPAGDERLALFYAGEHNGHAGSCGCSVSPKGGMAATNAIIQAAHDKGLPLVTLHLGRALASNPIRKGEQSHETAQDNLQMMSTLADWDAVNVSWSELGAAPPGANWVSANLRAADTYPTHQILQRGQERVLVTGVTKKGSSELWPAKATWIEPTKALTQLLATAHDADLVVVMASGIRDIRSLAAVDGVDIVLDADRHTGRWDASQVGHALWVRSPDGGERLGDLRLTWDDNGWTTVVDGQIHMGTDLRLPSPFRKLAKQLDR